MSVWIDTHRRNYIIGICEVKSIPPFLSSIINFDLSTYHPPLNVLNRFFFFRKVYYVYNPASFWFWLGCFVLVSVFVDVFYFSPLLPLCYKNILPISNVFFIDLSKKKITRWNILSLLTKDYENFYYFLTYLCSGFYISFPIFIIRFRLIWVSSRECMFILVSLVNFYRQFSSSVCQFSC